MENFFYFVLVIINYLCAIFHFSDTACQMSCSVFETYFVNCDETTFTCNSASAPHKHCNLCEKKFSTRYRCERHFTQAHASRAVVVEGQSCFPCRLEHNGKSTNRAHYHCPHCDKTIFIRNRFIKHLESHAKQKQVRSTGITTGL